MSMPKLVNVGCILFLFLFLYSVLGMHLFAKVKFNGAYDDHANFQTFYIAFLTLCRCMTGEAWNEMMHALGKPRAYFRGVLAPAGERIDCSDDKEVTIDSYPGLLASGFIENPDQCGHGVFAQVYFLTFTVVVMFICLNLVIAVVLEGFEDASSSDEKEVIGKCISKWREFDPDYEMMIPAKKAIEFIVAIRKEQDEEAEKERLRREAFREAPSNKASPQKTEASFSDLPVKTAAFLKLPVTTEHQVHFVHVVQCTLRMLVAKGDPAKMAEIEKMDDNLDEAFAQKQRKHLGPSQKSFDNQDDVLPLEVHVAAAKIQDLFKARRQRIAQRTLTEKQSPPAPPVEDEPPKQPEINPAA
jgi:hypothetical protein